MTIEDTLGKMLRLLESMDSKMDEPRGRREAGEKEMSTPAVQATESIVEVSTEPVVPGDRRTVVGMLSRIVDALKGVGIIPEKESDGKETESDGKEKESPLPRKRFGLNFSQARQGNGAFCGCSLKYF